MLPSKEIYDQVRSIAAKFGLSGTCDEISIIKTGHINYTYQAVINGIPYIVQKINGYVFPHPTEIMENIERVTGHIRKKLIEMGRDPDRGTLNYLRTPDGLNYIQDEQGDTWRVCPFISGTRTYDQVENLQMLESAGYAFGEFQRMLADFPMDQLHETIVDFHNTKQRYRNLYRSAELDLAGHAEECREDLAFFRIREKSACSLIDMLEKGELPLRVTHNDTKYNNILINPETFEAVCVIDLDTVMPGLSLYDFGDAMRFAANNALEDETDLSKVTVNLTYFDAFTRGFLHASGGSFTQAEIDNFALATVNITLEIGSRFLADYLDGDKYFAIDHPRHNLERARNQMKLAEDMEKHLDEMNAIVHKYA